MAESLKIKIEMAGAEEVKRQLQGMGEAGQEAFNKIYGAAKEVGSFKNIDPSVLTKAYQELGTKAPEALGKIQAAVKAASRAETLIGGLTAIQNGLGKVQTAATFLDGALGRVLLGSITKIARVLPGVFAASVVAGIYKTTQGILELDEAAIKAGVSIEEMGKLQEIFKALGSSSADAAKGVDAFLGGIDRIEVDKVQQAADEMKKFGVGTTEAISAIWKLQAAEKGRGAAAALARKELETAHLSRKTADEQELIRIQELKVDRSDQLMQAIGLFERMGNTVERNRLIFATFGKDFGTLLVQALNTGIGLDDIKKKLADLSTPSEAAAQAASRLSQAWQNLINLMASSTLSPETLNQAAFILEQIDVAVRAVGNGFVWLGEVIASFGLADMLANTWRELQNIGRALTELGEAAVNIWNNIKEGAIEAWDTVIDLINSAIEKVKDFFDMGGGQATAGGKADGYARGGFVGGRGSGTSDSNLAWVSRGEHIMPARAVRQPGVLSLLEALRRSGGNLRGVLDRMGHFAAGGMVGAPAFAAGGLAGGMSNVTIQFPGVQPISGLRASSAVVDELRRSAALAQVRSGGRKPSRYI